jgi:hypothetical protein
MGAPPSAQKRTVEFECEISGNGGMGAPPSAQTDECEEAFTASVLTPKPAGATITNSNAKTKSKAIARFIVEYLLRAFMSRAQHGIG